MRRRDFALALGAASAALMAPRVAWAQDEEIESDVTYSMLGEIEALQGRRIESIGPSNEPSPDRSVLRMSSANAGHDSPPLTDEVRAVLAERDWWRIPDAQKPQPTWISARASDYAHLSGFSLSSTQFDLDAGVLNRLAAANSFVINDLRPVLIFGLRGAKLLNGQDTAPWAATHRVEAVDPSHVDCACLIGILRKGDGMIALYRGTTVPAVNAMYKALPNNAIGTSMLPTGLYTYGIGTVHAGRPEAIQRGALRIQGRYCVFRTADDCIFDPYSENDAWTIGEYHQIHAAGSNLQKPGSNGCQVIPGGYRGSDSTRPRDRMRSHGAWADFRTLAGLADADGLPVADEASPTFQYMLLTGREAALAYQGGAAFQNGYRRLRHGSSGPAVLRLQRRLYDRYPIEGARDDGSFGMVTSFASLWDKKETVGEYTTPIVSI